MKKGRTEIKTPYRYYDHGIKETSDETNEAKILEGIAVYIGWIVIEFNSLESQVNFQIKEQLSRSESQDEIVYLYLSKMPMGEKIDLLIKLYGIWAFNQYEMKQFVEPLKNIEFKLKQANTSRNRYAHTNWSEMYDDRLFKIKTQSKKDGVYHTFLKFDEEHLEEDLKSIRELHNELWDFHEEFSNYMNMHTERILVFSYGSNMFNPRLKTRVPSTRVMGIGKIIGFKLGFSKRSKDGSGKATLVETKEKSDVVWGTLSIIDKSEKVLLDKVEGLNNGYIEEHREIVTEEKNNPIACFYIAESTAKDVSLKPYDWYKTLVVEGAKLNDLPKEYIDYLNNIDFSMDKNEQRRRKALLILNLKSC